MKRICEHAYHCEEVDCNAQKAHGCVSPFLTNCNLTGKNLQQVECVEIDPAYERIDRALRMTLNDIRLVIACRSASEESRKTA
jgi:hypothetical protein